MTECALCAYADVHGWWGDYKITHSRMTHRTWSRTSRECECAACGRHFGGNEGFDAHQRTSPAGVVCLDPSTLKKPLRLDENDVWRRPAPRIFS